MPVDRSDEPGKAETQKHVDAVTSGHVSDAVVGVLLLQRGCFAGEQIRKRRSQGNKSDRRHAWLENKKVTAPKNSADNHLSSRTSHPSTTRRLLRFKSCRPYTRPLLILYTRPPADNRTIRGTLTDPEKAKVVTTRVRLDHD